MPDTTDLEQISDPDFRGLCEQALTHMRDLRVPGVGIALRHAGREHFAGLGVTSVDHPLPVTPGTLFQIGSISKTFLAMAAMRLVESGRLDLDVPVRAYLPGLRLADEEVARAVTMRHLLTHTGGWVGDYFDDFGNGDDALARIVESLADLPQLTPLGEIWSYNNAGFYIAGRVIEVLAGKSFEAALGDLVFRPLGMEKAFFFAEDVLTHRFAVGHIVEQKTLRVARPWAIGRAIHAAGGIVTSARDLLAYGRFFLGDGALPDGTRLLSRESLAQLLTPVRATTGMSQVGLAWMLAQAGDVRYASHGGGTNGQISLLVVAPGADFALVVLTNSDEGSALCYRVSQWARERYLNAPLPVPLPIGAAAEQLAPFAGRYESAASSLELRLEGGKLMAHVTPKGGFPKKDSPPSPAPPPAHVDLYAEDRVIIVDPPELRDTLGEFLRDPEGRIAWFRVGGRVHRREA